ncbi:hypothetical protein EXE44_07140 [Halorubrum sp. SS7]|uniref:DUF7542 family protein n=1 Tax=Halorubrum sp. SS7 TaxID=2518119 RepID=UPI0010F82C07|nr:hypothetical protein [Halorubrum sp. SS7]TKX58079.1 hypothetical protein EXE44_07140 [Halorubrum sp. SS7]
MATTVRCDDCSYEEAFDSLRRARTAVSEHERSTGHAVAWEIESLAGGVERAGADAGVCGRPECANPDSPLLDRDAARGVDPDD